MSGSSWVSENKPMGKTNWIVEYGEQVGPRILHKFEVQNEAN